MITTNTVDLITEEQLDFVRNKDNSVLYFENGKIVPGYESHGAWENQIITNKDLWGLDEDMSNDQIRDFIKDLINDNLI
jgi:hypothetical protein